MKFCYFIKKEKILINGGSGSSRSVNGYSGDSSRDGGGGNNSCSQII